MATYTKISGMTAASALDGTELFEAVQSSNPVKVTAAQIMMPSGMILPFANTTAPDGYLACDASAVSRTTYAALFAAIGTVWGVGDGSNTFNVPDLRGAFVRGTGSNGTANMADGNDFAGPSVGATENDQMQGHFHTATGTIETGGGDENASYTWGSSATPGSHNTMVRAASTDGTNGTPRAGDETRPFAVGVLYCIKT